MASREDTEPSEREVGGHTPTRKWKSDKEAKKRGSQSQRPIGPACRAGPDVFIHETEKLLQNFEIDASDKQRASELLAAQSKVTCSQTTVEKRKQLTSAARRLEDALLDGELKSGGDAKQPALETPRTQRRRKNAEVFQRARVVEPKKLSDVTEVACNGDSVALRQANLDGMPVLFFDLLKQEGADALNEEEKLMSQRLPFLGQCLGHCEEPYLVTMEHGTPLSNVDSIPVRTRFRIAFQVSVALRALHRLGVAHSGLSHNCVFINESNDAFVGCVHLSKPEAPFAAPELARDDKPTTAATTYAFGVLLRLLFADSVPSDSIGGPAKS